jgi:hypothetical protein
MFMFEMTGLHIECERIKSTRLRIRPIVVNLLEKKKDGRRAQKVGRTYSAVTHKVVRTIKKNNAKAQNKDEKQRRIKNSK